MPKEPKIVQMVANEHGRIVAVLHDDGRVFESVAVGEPSESTVIFRYEWREMMPPIPLIPLPPRPAQSEKRRRK